jgi:hypothetical protein
VDTLNFLENLQEVVAQSCLRIVNLDGTYQWHCTRCGDKSTPQSTLALMESNMTGHYLGAHYGPQIDDV